MTCIVSPPYDDDGIENIISKEMVDMMGDVKKCSMKAALRT